MKKDELNKFNIRNPDGLLRDLDSETPVSYYNDVPRSVVEDSSGGSSEWKTDIDEAADPVANTRAQSAGSSGAGSSNLTSNLQSLTSSATRVGSTMATTLGSGVGVLVGITATSVVAAVVIVATYLSLLTINVSLLFADMHQLVLQVEMVGAQQEDFEHPIWAYLEADGEVRYSQELHIDTTYLTFDDLEADTEYTLRIENEDGKVYANRTFFTTATPPDRGHLEAWQEEDVVYISVTDVVLKPTEFYTVSAKNEDAKVIFVADDVEPNKQFSFRLERPTDLFFALSIGSKTYAVMQIEHAPQPEPQPEHEYDFYSASWIWADNLESAVLRVPDLTAGGTVDMPAIIESSIHVQPTCTSEGGALYVATVTAQGHDYTDERTKPIAALGHDYGQPTFEWTPVYEDPTYAGAAEEPITQDDPTQTVLTYTAIATWVCSRNPNHTHAEEATVEAQPYTPATCTEDGYKTYTATATMAGVDYEAQRVDVFEGTAMGHTYDTQPTFEWTQLSNGGYTAVAVFVCSVDGYQMTMDADMSIEQHSWDDNICEGTGDATYTAMVLWGDELYSDSREASVNAIGHRFDEYYFNWDADADGVHGATLVLVCSINSEHTLELEAQLTVDSASPTCTEEGHIYYTATVVYDDHEYSDMYPVTLPALEHEYGEEPEWTWTPDGNGGYTATATWVCIHDSSHVQVVDAVVALNVNDNTDVCTEGGHVTYTATAEFGDNEYQTEYEVDVEPLGHDYSEEPEWDWQDDGNGNMMATAIFYCSRNPEHEMELEAEVTQEETNEGTLYTATVVYNSVEHSDTYLVG